MPRCLWAALSLVLWTSPALCQVHGREPGPRLTGIWERWNPDPAESNRLPQLGARSLTPSAKWAIGGAIVGGVLAAAVANALCERSSGCTGFTLQWALVGAAAGAAAGALIGSTDDE